MRTFVQPGDMLTCTAPTGGVVSGTGYLLGDLFVVAATTAAEGEAFEGMRVGVHTLAAEAHATDQALDVGDIAYFDAGEGRLTKTATDNSPVGIVTSIKESTATTATIVLTPGFLAILADLESRVATLEAA